MTKLCQKSTMARLLTISQSVKPVLHPLRLHALFSGLQFSLLLATCSLVILYYQSRMVNCCGIRRLEIISHSRNNSCDTSRRTVILYLRTAGVRFHSFKAYRLEIIDGKTYTEYDATIFTTLEKSHNILNPTYSQQNEMSTSWLQERAKYGLLVKAKMSLSVSRGEPRGPSTNDGKPSMRNRSADPWNSTISLYARIMNGDKESGIKRQNDERQLGFSATTKNDQRQDFQTTTEF